MVREGGGEAVAMSMMTAWAGKHVQAKGDGCAQGRGCSLTDQATTLPSFISTVWIMMWPVRWPEDQEPAM